MDLSALNPRISPTEFEQAVKNMIELNFSDAYLFHVVEERRLYNPRVSEYIWEQNKGTKPHVCEVYFDGEYVCDIPSNMQPDKALKLIKDNVVLIIARKATNNADLKWKI